MKIEIYTGWISKLDVSYDSGHGVYLNGSLLSEQLDITGKNVTVRYWISDKELTKEQLIESTVLTLCGAGYSEHNSAYSEYTGYLWTDDDIKIGGHDLQSELYDSAGKWLHLEIEIHD